MSPEQATFERHYRIGELADIWKLGRETVRLLVKEDDGVIRFGSAAGRRTRSTPFPNQLQYEFIRACCTAGNTQSLQALWAATRNAAGGKHRSG